MSNEEQKQYWNGDAGERWAKDDQTMETLLRPLTQDLLAHAAPGDCSSALDVGCGGGSQSILLAGELGAGASVLGVDISEPMLKVARSKVADLPAGGPDIDFLLADAAENHFEAGSFDLVFSRFGVMFFDDPVAAFTNIAAGLRPGGRLVFCCWQALQKNDWTWLPLQAALKHLPPPPPPEPHAPGPFAFADAARLEDILAASGFRDIELKSQEVTMQFGPSDSLAESVRELARLGPIGRLLVDQPESKLENVFSAIEEALDPSYDDGYLALPGAVWFVTARAQA